MNYDWYPFNPTEYRRDTYHLSAAADGIYRRLIDEYMVTGKPLPDSDAALAGIARVTEGEWLTHRDVLRAFFKAVNGRLAHKRCDKELNAQRMRAAERSKRAKEAATLRWAKEKIKQRDGCNTHAGSNADAMPMPATIHNNTNLLSTASIVEGPGTSDYVPRSPSFGKSLRRIAE